MMRSLTLNARLLVILALALTPAVALAVLYAWQKFVLASAMPQAASAPFGLGTDIGLIALSSLAGLGMLWVAAERWCLRPLKPIQAAAAAIARGNFAPPRPVGPTTPEMEAHDVFALGAAISVRESALQASLEQREHMLCEIHHRVKNNLQMILSLLNLQADKIRSPRILRLFGDARNRVLALSILHQHLYERSDWSSVDFQAYISDLVDHLSARRSLQDKPMVRCRVQALVMAVGPDTAIPVGLIVTEAVSNAFSHAFANTMAPEIRITTELSNGDIVVTIDDNGSGIGEDGTAPGQKQGLGVNLMRGLAAQLGGSIDILSRAGGGTRVRLQFRKPRHAIVDGPIALPGARLTAAA
ncbi:MAG: sensor histidine kinase [Reyranella sp.]|nr:sensor histidine kinase [Reyranella sp.]